MLDSGTKHPENRIHLFDPVGLINDNYGGGYKSSSNAAVRPRRPTKSYGNFEEVNANEGIISYDSFKSDANNVGSLTSHNSFSTETNGVGIGSYDHNHNHDHDHTNDGNDGLELRFGVDKSKDLEDDSDDSTPRLWKPLKSSSFLPTSPKSMNSSPFNQTSPKHEYSQNMSPSSRTRAIAKGRRELMDMVKDLPESFYELSLKDIVEQKAELEVQKGIIDIPEEKATLQEISKPEMTKERKIGKKVKKSESKKKMVRSRSVDNGTILLRTSVFPIFSGLRKKKKGLGGGSNSLKVAPVGRTEPGSNGPMKGGEKEWWRRKSCISSESDVSNGLSSKSASSGSSSSSRSLSISSNGRRSNTFSPICCLFNGKRITSKK